MACLALAATTVIKERLARWKTVEMPYRSVELTAAGRVQVMHSGKAA